MKNKKQENLTRLNQQMRDTCFAFITECDTMWYFQNYILTNILFALNRYYFEDIVEGLSVHDILSQKYDIFFSLGNDLLGFQHQGEPWTIETYFAKGNVSVERRVEFFRALVEHIQEGMKAIKEEQEEQNRDVERERKRTQDQIGELLGDLFPTEE